VLISNISFTLQNPTGRIGTPFSSLRNAPQDPGPVSTGERIAVSGARIRDAARR